jgi:hypothetical protein
LKLKNNFFLLKKIDSLRDEDGAGIPERIGDGDEIQFFIHMGRVTDKYMEVGDEDGEGKTRPHPAPLPCLDAGEDEINTLLILSRKKLLYCLNSMHDYL